MLKDKCKTGQTFTKYMRQNVSIVDILQRHDPMIVPSPGHMSLCISFCWSSHKGRIWADPVIPLAMGSCGHDFVQVGQGALKFLLYCFFESTL